VVRVSGYRSRDPGLFPALPDFLRSSGPERGPLSLVSTTEELLERKSSGSGLETREYGCRDPSRWPRGTIYPQKLALTSLTSVGRSVGIVRSRTRVTEFVKSSSHCVPRISEQQTSLCDRCKSRSNLLWTDIVFLCVPLCARNTAFRLSSFRRDASRLT
jgi:hypothetical protein